MTLHKPDAVRRELSQTKRALLEKLLRGNGVGGEVSGLIPRRLEVGPAPLSYAQQCMWGLHQLNPSSPAYNVPRAFRIQGELDEPALEKTFREIVRRHEALRTTIQLTNGDPIQVIGEVPDNIFLIIDLRSLPPVDRLKESSRLAQQEGVLSFDLARGPLLRARLLRMGQGEHIALLTLHHIVSDGWSTAVLVQEVKELYEAFSIGKPSPLPELPIQYADYAVWQRSRLQGVGMEQSLAYWKRQLGGTLPVLELPIDRIRLQPSAGDAAAMTMTFPLSLSKSLTDLSHGEGVTLFMTLLAIFNALLHRYSGQQDIIVGAVVANRDRSEVEKLIGCFVNTVALRSNLSGNPTFRELLARVKNTCLDAYKYQETPFEMVLASLQVGRRSGYPPLFQVLFVLQNVPEQAFHLRGLALAPLNNRIPTSKFALSLIVAETAQGLIATFEYDASLFSEQSIARFLHHFQLIADQVCAAPDTKLKNIVLSNVDDDRRSIDLFNEG